MFLWNFLGLFFLGHCIYCLSIRKEHSVYDPRALASVNDDCDPSSIPVMHDFDIHKFSGEWFELAKTAAGYIDVSDGAWVIESTNTSTKFLFSGRDNNQHCIRPIKGKVSASQEPPGMLKLSYQTYSSHVEESVRILFTDYVSVAVVYTCMHHVHHEREVCHAAGIFGAIWTRKPHVNVDLYQKAVRYLEMACVHKSTLIMRNIVGPCRVDDLEFRIDDFPAPDYCYQMVDSGFCRGSIQRYYFDPKEKACKLFTYGGCGGNQNKFMSLSECQMKCITTSTNDPVCMSVAKCGLHCSPCCTEDKDGCVKCDCEHIIEEDFLNCIRNPTHCPNECAVENFYPGCHACRCGENSNKGLSDVCNEAKSEGNCKGRIERYYYNDVTGQCEMFQYSGCGGNSNNFKSQEECQNKCQNSVHLYANPVIEHTNSSNIVNCYLMTIILMMILHQKLQLWL